MNRFFSKAAREERRNARAVAHFPEHLLRDVGFQTDWRGRVVRLPRESR